MSALNCDVLRRGAIIGLPSLLVVGFWLWWPGEGLLDKHSTYIGRDFGFLWLAGRLALEGRVAEIYDLTAYWEALKATFGAAHRYGNMSYPPHLIPLILPLSALPYFAAWGIWQIGGLIGFTTAALGRLPRRSDVTATMLLVISPVAVLNLFLGQAGGLLAALFIGAWRLVPTRPLLAGVLYGILTVKPQIGLLVAVALLFHGCWRTIAAALMTAAGLVALSLLILGVEPWIAYVQNTIPQQERFLFIPDGFLSWMMHTPYDMLWLKRIPAGLALQLHAVIAVMIAI
ncbi:MAG: glycosyltransferase family 87 protein, partial [Hyphomicrobiaceae bacterium]